MDSLLPAACMSIWANRKWVSGNQPDTPRPSFTSHPLPSFGQEKVGQWEVPLHPHTLIHLLPPSLYWPREIGSMRVYLTPPHPYSHPTPFPLLAKINWVNESLPYTPIPSFTSHPVPPIGQEKLGQWEAPLHPHSLIHLPPPSLYQPRETGSVGVSITPPPHPLHTHSLPNPLPCIRPFLPLYKTSAMGDLLADRPAWWRWAYLGL